MASAPRQASYTSSSSDPEVSETPVDGEPATVEESLGNFDLIGTLRDMVSTGSHPLGAIYTTVADASRAMSGADGTALALEAKGVIVCRARSGDIAPGLGAPISRESGISGECLRTSSMLVCHDTWSDPRVDAEVCQALGIRSVVAVPLLQGTRGIGILEAFSSRPDAFDGDALSSLRALGEIAQIAYLRDQPSIPAPPVAAAPAVAAPKPAKYVPRDFSPAELSPPSSETGKNHVWKIAAIVVGVLLTVAVAWWAWHAPEESTGTTQTAHAAATVEPPTMKPLAIQVLPKPAPGFTSSKRSAATPQPDIVLQNAADLQPVEEHTADAAMATPAAPTRTTAPSEPEPAVEPPAVTVSGPADSQQLARITSVEAHLPAGGPVVSQGVVEPVLVHRVDATYPLQARSQRLSGKVTLLATIAADGSIRNLKVETGSPILALAAKNAVQQWRYRPATLNGTPIDVQKEITFIFEQP